MRAPEQFVASLVDTPDEGNQREKRRRRRIDFIVAGNKERLRLSKERMSDMLRRGVNKMSAVERELLKSLGSVGDWWDFISKRALEEKMECEKAVMMQKQLNSTFFTATMEREVTEQTTVIQKDARRMQELVDWCIAEEQRVKSEAIKEAMNSILAAVDRCIVFIEEYFFEGRGNSVLTDIALNSFIRRINNTPLSQEDTASIFFGQIFYRHPLELTGDPFLQLLHCMYQKLDSGLSPITCFDISRKPLFLIDGSKLSGKTIVSRMVAAKLSMQCFSDRDLVDRALKAYRVQRDGLPTLRTVEYSDALPVISAYEERDKDDNEVAYHSEARVMQVSESFVCLSPLAEVGKVIETALLLGKPVDPSLVVQLVQLTAVDAASVECNGILFDGVVSGVEGLRTLQGAISNKTHLFGGALRGCPSSAEEPSLSSALLHVEREVQCERSVMRSEGRQRPPKKGIDFSTLPPPLLPEVTREELTEEEKSAIQRWEGEEHARHPLYSAVLRFHCTPHEAFNRFAGLRVDKETGEIYHILFDPPPPARAPYVVNLDRTRTSTTQLHSVLFTQQNDWAAIQRWMRSEEGKNQNMYEVNAEQPLDEIATNVEHILQRIQKEYEERLLLYDVAMAAKRRRAQITASIAEQEELREAERKRLVAVYSECGAPIPTELEPPVSTAPFYTMPDKFPEKFMSAFLDFRKQYESAYSFFGATLEVLVKALLNYRLKAMNTFRHFWYQPDEKQEKLDRFIASYNRVPVALLGQVPCKEELHLLVDQLKEELFRVVDATGKEASAKIEQITKKDSFWGQWSFLICNVGVAMVQMEVERFLATINLCAMYFSAVVDEPCIFDDFESEVIILRSFTETAVDQAKGKDKKVQSSKKMQKPDEVAEKPAEEMFAEVIVRLTGALGTYVEKFISLITTLTKLRESGKATTALTDDGRQLLILTKCSPFLETELEMVQKRITCIRQFFSRLLHEGESYCARIKEDMVARARDKQMNQASAVNTAVYLIRIAIEEEKSIGIMHLGRETFYASPAEEEPGRSAHASSSFSQPLTVTHPGELKIHSTLTALRLMEMISAFRSVAPNYALSRTEFFHIVQESDYTESLVSNHGRFKSKEEVFATFDLFGCGLIDWREFVVHLLLWCAPAPETPSAVATVESFYISEPTLEELLDLRLQLGLEKVTKDTFYNVSFFFSKDMTVDRLGAYINALRMTFEDKDGMIDPLPLLVFMCMDRQSIRGVQKVFSVVSRNQDDSLTPNEMFVIFHVNATNPRDMCLPDCFSLENIAILYDGAFSLTFSSACRRVMGRSMFNNRIFGRKSFVVQNYFAK